MVKMDADLWKNTSLIAFFVMRPVLDDFIGLYCIAKKDYFTIKIYIELQFDISSLNKLYKTPQHQS